MSQYINYGSSDYKISESVIRENWIELEPKLDPERARMIKYLIWGKASLQKIKKSYWGLFPKTTS
jgi:hypothetical protein